MEHFKQIYMDRALNIWLWFYYSWHMSRCKWEVDFLYSQEEYAVTIICLQASIVDLLISAADTAGVWAD